MSVQFIIVKVGAEALKFAAPGGERFTKLIET